MTFTATVAAVAPGAGTPDGTVQFKDGGSPVGAPVALAGGVATFSISSLTTGTHAITAEYGGTSNFDASTGALDQVVNAADTGTVLTSSTNPSVFGEPVTFTATVARGGAFVSEGSVTFKDGGTVVAGPIAVDIEGQAAFETAVLDAGSHLITAEYSGPSTSGEAVTFTATVTTAEGANRESRALSSDGFRDVPQAQVGVSTRRRNRGPGRCPEPVCRASRS